MSRQTGQQESENELLSHLSSSILKLLPAHVRLLVRAFMRALTCSGLWPLWLVPAGRVTFRKRGFESAQRDQKALWRPEKNCGCLGITTCCAPVFLLRRVMAPQSQSEELPGRHQLLSALPSAQS